LGRRFADELHRIERIETERPMVHERITQVCGEGFASRCCGGGQNGSPHGFDYLQDSVQEAFEFARLSPRQMQAIAALVSETVPLPAATRLYFSKRSIPVPNFNQEVIS
jgi:hypothetical protein